MKITKAQIKQIVLEEINEAARDSEGADVQGRDYKTHNWDSRPRNIGPFTASPERVKIYKRAVVTRLKNALMDAEKMKALLRKTGTRDPAFLKAISILEKFQKEISHASKEIIVSLDEIPKNYK